MTTKLTSDQVGISIHGLYVHATAPASDFSLGVSIEPGLRGLNNPNDPTYGMTYIQASPSVTTSPASSGKVRLDVVQIQNSGTGNNGNPTIKNGVEVDEVSGYSGKSVSDITPAISIAAGNIKINLDGDGVQTVALAANTTGAAIAADIQAKVRALTAITGGNQPAYNNFTCVYDSGSRVFTVGAEDDSVLQVIRGSDGLPAAIDLIPGANKFESAFAQFATDGTTIWLYVRASFRGAVRAYDMKTGDRLASFVAWHDIPSSGFMEGIACDGTNIWSSKGDVGENKVYVADKLTGVQTGFSPLTIANGIGYLLSAGANVWMGANNTELHVRDAATGAATGFSPITVPYAGAEMAYDGTNIWVPDGVADNNVTVIVAATGSAALISPVAVGHRCDKVVIAGANAWLLDQTSTTLSIVNKTTGVPVGFSPITLGFSPTDICYDGSAIWVSEGFNQQMEVFDATTGAPKSFSPVAMTSPFISGHLVSTATDIAQYTLTSGTQLDTSSVVVTAGATNDRAASLKLGVAHSGAESVGKTAVSPVVPDPDFGYVALATVGGSARITDVTIAFSDDDITNSVAGR